MKKQKSNILYVTKMRKNIGTCNKSEEEEVAYDSINIISVKEVASGH